MGVRKLLKLRKILKQLEIDESVLKKLDVASLNQLLKNGPIQLSLTVNSGRAGVGTEEGSGVWTKEGSEVGTMSTANGDTHAANGERRVTVNSDVNVTNARELICQLCKQMYNLGWATGTGGGTSIRIRNSRDHENGDVVVMTPSGVQKEMMKIDDLFVVETNSGRVLTPSSDASLKLSQCAPLFLAAYQLRDAGCVLHSHSKNVVLASVLACHSPHDHPHTATHSMYQLPGEECNAWLVGEIRISNFEMLKGLKGYKSTDTTIIPVIRNTEEESQLEVSLRAAISAYPHTYAVVVHKHGIYVWGHTWQQAKIHAECYDYLLEMAWRLKDQH